MIVFDWLVCVVIEYSVPRIIDTTPTPTQHKLNTAVGLDTKMTVHPTPPPHPTPNHPTNTTETQRQHLEALDEHVCAQIFTKICLLVNFSVMSLSFKFHKDLIFCSRNIC